MRRLLCGNRSRAEDDQNSLACDYMSGCAQRRGSRQGVIAKAWGRPGRSGGGGCGLTVGRLGDDLDPVVECHTENEFWRLVVTVETAPAFLCALDQFEDHRERGPVRQTALRSDGAVAHGGEGALDGVGPVRKC